MVLGTTTKITTNSSTVISLEILISYCITSLFISLVFTDLKAQIQELTRSKAAVPVFSVVVCTNPLESPNDQSKQAETAPASSPIKNEPISFGTFEIETAKEYGDFNLKTGIFTVKKSGIFQFNFTGLTKITDGNHIHRFDLSVD